MSILSFNKRIKFDYDILETFEAGIVLTGQEVKSVRQGAASLQGAYVIINPKKEAYLINANIPLYKMANPTSLYEPTRSRKLLLHKKELNYLNVKLQQTGLTLVPISLYTRGKKIKLELALVKGKKLFDKRKTIKEREEKRKIQQILKRKFQL